MISSGKAAQARLSLFVLSVLFTWAVRMKMTLLRLVYTIKVSHQSTCSNFDQYAVYTMKVVQRF